MAVALWRFRGGKGEGAMGPRFTGREVGKRLNGAVFESRISHEGVDGKILVRRAGAVRKLRRLSLAALRSFQRDCKNLVEAFFSEFSHRFNRGDVFLHEFQNGMKGSNPVQLQLTTKGQVDQGGVVTSTKVSE